MLAVATGGNRFIELLAEASVLRNSTGKDWDTLCGISAGALLCGLISMIPMDDVEAFNSAMSRATEQFTKDASASPFRPWIPLAGFASALFAVLFKPSLYQGNAEFVKSEFDKQKFHASGRRLLVGVFDNTLQKYKTVDSKFHSPLDMRRAIAASSAVPVVTPPQMFQGHLCRDGGMVHTVPVREIVAFVQGHRRQWPVHVDLLISDGIQQAPPPKSKTTVTTSMLDVCTSMVWLNLQRDLRQLVRKLLTDTTDDVENVLWTLRSGKQRNFERQWGTLRVVSPIDLAPRRRVRTKFRVPTKSTAMQLMREGKTAAEAAL